MLLNFNLYDLFILSFVQLIVSTLLVLSPAREIRSRFRWTGSRITEVLVSAVGAVAIAAVSCLVTHLLWGIPLGNLASAAYVLVIVAVAVVALQPDRNVVGQVFYASFASASLAFTLWTGYVGFIASRGILETVTASFVLLLDAAALLVWMSNINYQSDVLCRARRGQPLPEADPGYLPMVSLHIPAHNEPPELLIQTIKAAEAIDYPDFEIVVVDNNTADPAVWGPVEEYCRDRPRVKFVHVDPWPGYKAGACNLALTEYTDPRAEVIGLIDADDLVQPYYLRETIPYFSDQKLGFIQTFEGNREYEGSAYYTACVDSFQSFYLSVMSSRNERDAVPFVGTMGLFRRSALTSVGGWNEWCICEDTEASLRVAKDGWSGLFIPRCFGRGIVPPSFAGMLVQRHRWCFGAMQILRLHWRSLMPWDRSPGNQLTAAQRRDYLMASLSWFRDLIMLAFSLLLVLVTVLLVTDSSFAVSPLDGDRSLLPLSLIIIATICMMFTQRYWTTLSYRRAFMSLVISLGVAFVIARGCIEGVARRDGVFLRTSKAGGSRTTLGALRLTKWETALALALYASVGVLATLPHRPWLLMALIFIQASVYLCAPIASIWNLRASGVSREAYRERFAKRRRRAQRRRHAAWAPVPRRTVAALAALSLGAAASVFAAPVSLLHATTVTRANQAPAADTDVYLKLGSAYEPITNMRLSDRAASARGGPARVALRFDTSSAALLGEVLRASANGGRTPRASLAFRTRGKAGRVETFAAGTVTSVEGRLSGKPAGSVSLLLPASGDVKGSPPVGSLARRAPATRAYVAIGREPHRVRDVRVSQTEAGADVGLTFSTSAQPLLDGIFKAEGIAEGVPSLTLSVRDRSGARVLSQSFSELSVSSFTQAFAGPQSGTATLVARPR